MDITKLTAADLKKLAQAGKQSVAPTEKAIDKAEKALKDLAKIEAMLKEAIKANPDL